MRLRSRWRETNLLLRLIDSALWPPLPIEDCLRRWSTFQLDLAERRRNRRPRIENLLS
jgi:hypothetical protein